LLEGTVYLAPSGGNLIWHFNPVYQSPDGSVYAVSGSGMNTDCGQSEGEKCSQTIESSCTVTENGVTKTYSTSVKISYSFLFPPERVRILQLDGDGSIVDDAEYPPGETPKTLTPETDTAYIIVETYKTDAEGNEKISRELYQRSDGTLETFVCRDDGVCVKRWTELKWPGDEAPDAGSA
jgi:hypothetical protein